MYTWTDEEALNYFKEDPSLFDMVLIQMEGHHSPRIQARKYMEAEKKRKKQRDVRLNNRRIPEKEKRAAMMENERQVLLQKRRNTYCMRTAARDTHANKNECEASTSSVC
ncbi:hypothetical protein MKX03_008522 [Papaver bracteatum]|nr:hypothetical protein MKX03_008522 [Papaver bracteatum]